MPGYDYGRQMTAGGHPPAAPPGYAPPPGSYPPGWYQPKPPKGWEFGLPSTGPGSVAPPVKRFLARLLDGLFFIPVSAAVIALAIVLSAPHYGPLFPTRPTCPHQGGAYECPVNNQFPGFLWLELTIVAAGIVSTAAYVIADATITSHWQRTPGKAIMHIRPIHLTDRTALGFWTALARAGAVSVAGFLSWIGLIDYLWCLWDPNGQCVHDKILDTVVVTDV